jgi:hypothetical protein
MIEALLIYGWQGAPAYNAGGRTAARTIEHWSDQTGWGIKRPRWLRRASFRYGNIGTSGTEVGLKYGETHIKTCIPIFVHKEAVKRLRTGLAANLPQVEIQSARHINSGTLSDQDAVSRENSNG